MKVTEQDIKTVASLSRLSIREDEKAEVIAQLDKGKNSADDLRTADAKCFSRGRSEKISRP